MIAGGLGLYIGSILTLKINARRFLSHTNRRTEHDAPSNGGQRSSLNSGFHPRRG